MLKDILKIIQEKGYLSQPQLAKALHVEDGVIEDGIRQLLRMGYLIEENTGVGCAEFCLSCPFAKSCHKEIIKTFKLSDGAREFIANIP